MHRAAKALLVFALTLSSLLIVQTSASAAPTRNGVCEDGEVCFYFNSNQAGALSDMNYPLGDYGSGASCNHFLGAGKNGNGYCLKNNAASVWNRTKLIAVVYYNSQFQGASEPFNPGVKANLNSTLKNQNASHTFKNVPPPPHLAEPYFYSWQDGAGNIHHHAYVTFKASDLYNGRHVKQVYVRITRLNCWLYPDGDTGQVLSMSASSPSDTTTYKVETDLWDSPNFRCPMRSYHGVAEYF